MHKALANSVQWMNKSKSFTHLSKNQSKNGFKHSSFKSTCGLMMPIRFNADLCTNLLTKTLRTMRKMEQAILLIFVNLGVEMSPNPTL